MDDLLDRAPCGFVAFRDDGTIVAINRTLLDLLGYGPDELAGTHVERILALASRIFFQTHLFPLVTLHGHAEEIFLILRARDGSDLGALLNAIRRERGGVNVTDCIVIPVRERRKFEDALLRAKREAEDARSVLELQQRQLEEQATELEAAGEQLRMLNEELTARSEELERQRAAAEDANRAKSGFLAVMSHELRTPLNAIGGYVQLLELGIHGTLTPEQRHALSRVGRAQQHLLRLINEVLNLARIESGHVEYALEDVPLAESVAAVEPMIAPQIAAKRLLWEVRVPTDLVARCDREKTQQILINLVGNAVKFTPEGGRLRVEGESPSGASAMVRITVCDTGVGIPPSKLETIFQPFEQVDSSQTRVAEGSGLGLAISRELAHGMRGELEARSVVGEGSAFTLTLPRAPGS